MLPLKRWSEISATFFLQALKPDSTPLLPHFLRHEYFKPKTKATNKLLYFTWHRFTFCSKSELTVKKCQSWSHTRWQQDQIVMQTCSIWFAFPLVSLHCMHSCHLICDDVHLTKTMISEDLLELTGDLFGVRSGQRSAFNGTSSPRAAINYSVKNFGRFLRASQGSELPP